MAFSAVTERGSATEKTSDTSIAVSPSANLTVGKIVFVYAVLDNSATTQGASTNHDTLTDTDGHTWNKVFERTRTAGAAADGVTHSLWWTKVTTQIDTTDTITLTIDTAVTAKVLTVFEVTITGTTIQVADDGTSSAFQEASTSTPSVATSAMTSQEYLHLGLMGKEDSNLLWTEDADYTNVFAAEGVGTTGGTGTTNVVAQAGSRIATLTGDTFAPSLGAARDIAVALVAFEEVTSTDRRYQMSWTELELPNEPRRYQVSWAELEIPNEPRRYQLSWAELEIPNEPRRYQMSWAEFEVPNAPAGDRRYQVSFTELEIPEFSRRYQMSWTEFEIPNEPAAPATVTQRASYPGVQAPY